MALAVCKEKTCGKIFEAKNARNYFCSSECCKKHWNRENAPKSYLSYRADIENDDEEFEDDVFLIKVFQRMTGRACAV